MMIFQEAALNIVLATMMAIGLPIENQEIQKEIYCGATNIYFEAANQPLEGQIAISDVVLNRKKSASWPDSVCEVVWQPRQFSWTFDGKSDDIPLSSPYQIQLWSSAVYSYLTAWIDPRDLSDCSTHYHNKYIRPWWAVDMEKTVLIGDHQFLK